MPLRSKKVKEIQGFLRRPLTLKPKLRIDIDVEKYIKEYRKYLYYENFYYNIKDLALTDRNKDTYLNFYNIYKDDNSVAHYSKFEPIKLYNKLKNSEMYDTSICKMVILEVENRHHLSIYFPRLFLSVVNENSDPIEIKDIYFYIKNSSLYAFRTTLDVSNPKFIHPHINGNFGSYCLGSSPLKMSLDNLHYQIDTFNEDDADIFWINFYRTITQKTEHGDHYYALNRLSRGMGLDWGDFLPLVFSNEEFINSFKNYINIALLDEEVLVGMDVDNIKKDFFTLFSYETNPNVSNKETLEKYVRVDDIPIKNKNLITIYKHPRKIYDNIDSLLYMFIKHICPTEVINSTYDDYKEKLNESNNSGGQSVEQNQIFEFQML